MIEEPGWRSADLIRAEVEIERQLQQKVAESADTRAGLLLGFAGVLAGVTAGAGIGAIPGAVASVVAAVLAASVLWPRPMSTLNPHGLTVNYANQEAPATAREVLMRRVADYEKNKDIAEHKLNRLRAAIRALVIAIVLTAVGLILQTLVDTIAG